MRLLLLTLGDEIPKESGFEIVISQLVLDALHDYLEEKGRGRYNMLLLEVLSAQKCYAIEGLIFDASVPDALANRLNNDVENVLQKEELEKLFQGDN